jgi:hypothetical protein
METRIAESKRDMRSVSQNEKDAMWEEAKDSIG